MPISLGESHRGFPVVATSPAYFEHFRYGERRPLVLAEGHAFADVFDAVLGAEVAERLGYRMGQRVVLSHGNGVIAGNDHADKPFTVVGILARSGTPVDRSVHIGLDGMEAIHLDWIAGAPLPGRVAEAVILTAIVFGGTAASLLPGWRAYRLSLADGLSPGS